MLRSSPVLHQEFHALAYCSSTIRQIDFTNCTRPVSAHAGHSQNGRSLEFLAPILNLLRSGATRCNRLLLRGNALSRADIEDLGEFYLLSRVKVYLAS